MDTEKGSRLVQLARRAVETYLETGKLEDPPGDEWLRVKRGVFVSIYSYPVKELRGCIGYPLPTLPLGEATIRAAVASAVEDPRFPPLSLGELPHVVFEVSVLTEPVELDVSERRSLPQQIDVGVEGLIIDTPFGSGLLLPQVPVEYGWDAEEFLSHLCIKAGLNPTYWLQGKMRLYKFTADVFAEERPKGPITKQVLSPGKC
ncbi:MAG: TIGR00296 family protein [Candidatus Caldarchaeum sp.]